MVELADVVTELEAWDNGKGMIFHGIGNQFCSGADLNTVKHIADPVNANRLCIWMQTLLTRMRRLPIISVALLQVKK